MYKIGICAKYNIFLQNITKEISNNNLPQCNMKQYAGFQQFASTQQVKQHQGDFHSDGLNQSTENVNIRARSNTHTDYVK